MKFSKPNVTSRIMIAAAIFFCFAMLLSSAEAVDFSKYNLTPEQIATYSSLDSATQAKIINYLENNSKNGAGTGAATSRNSLKSDSLKTGTASNTWKTDNSSGGQKSGISPNTPDNRYSINNRDQEDFARSQGMEGEMSNSGDNFQQNRSEKQNTDMSSPPNGMAPLDENEPLKPYGYEIFAGENQFEPTIQIPIPENYLLGIGDTVVLHLYGKTSATNELTVTREGNLEVPDLGVVNVTGMTFSDARNELIRRVKSQMIGVDASVTMGELRSMRVYIMGEVAHPGSYAVSSLATVTNALFACGGIKESGSLRAIQLKRSGKLVGEMDLYNLLMHGDNSQDARLEPGDVILVPPIGAVASVSGNVVRPAIYEIKEGTSVSGLLNLAGGCKPDAYLGISQLSRFDSSTSKRYTVSVNLASPGDTIVANGDALSVMKIPERVHDSVEIKGHVALPRSIQWREGMTIADAIPTMNDVLRDADLAYVLVISVDPATDRVSIRSTRLDIAIADRNSKWNLKINPMDEIVVLGDLSRKEISDVTGASSTSVHPHNLPDTRPAIFSDTQSKVFTDGRFTTSSKIGSDASDPRASDIAEIISQAEADADANSNDNFVNEERYEWISRIMSQLKAQRMYDEPDAFVEVTGAVRYPGEYPFEKGMRVLDLLRASQNIVPDSDMNYALLIKRVGDKSYVVNLRLPSSMDDESSVWNYELGPRDELHIFTMYGDRSKEIEPYLELMNRQSTQIEYAKTVSISGMVRHSGKYPFCNGMRVSDLVRAGGDFIAGAYTESAEITRSYVSDGKIYEIMHLNVDMASLMKGNASADVELQPMDNLIIRSVPQWTEQITVTIKGEVNFPGSYAVSDGETLLQLIKRAGGLTENAFPKGSVFVRQSLRDKEQQELDRLRARLRSDLAASVMQKAVPGKESAQISAELLDQLETSKAVGRMTIDLPEILGDSKRFPDIILKNGDILYVPKPQQEVTVLGEVMYPTSHIFRKGLSYKDYIRMSGGTSIHADKDRIYIIKANGSVQTTESSSVWFKSRMHVEQGDSIIVPFDAEYISALPLWKDVTGIIYNLSVSAAAVASF